MGRRRISCSPTGRQTFNTKMITKDNYLPDPESLKVQELTIGLPALRAGAFHCGKQCENPNNEFMLCRQEEKDPRKCIEEGKAVTSCALTFLDRSRNLAWRSSTSMPTAWTNLLKMLHTNIAVIHKQSLISVC